MPEHNIDVTKLPLEVRAKLAELDLELSEGDITSKGYEKKRARLLAPYVTKQQSHGQGASQAAPSPSTAAQRRAHRRLTREDNRYHSEIRTEAVMQALALHSKKQSMVPMPSKRTSGVYHGQRRDMTTDSSSDDDSVLDDDQPQRSGGGGRRSRQSHHSSQQQQKRQRPPAAIPETSPASSLGRGQGGSGHPPSSSPSPATQQPSGAIYANISIPGNTARSALADVMKAATPRGRQAQQPPDLTSNTNSRADRVNRYNQQHAHAQSVRVTNSGAITGLDVQDGGSSRQGKVSAKIQQLLNTLKRPKRKPLQEYFIDEEEELEMPPPDPNAPKAEGSTITPTVGEQLIIPSGLPRNLEAAVQRYGSATFKATCATVLDQNGKPSLSLTYGKLLSRSHKIAYNLLNKLGPKGDPTVKSGDRVGLVYPNNDPISFICAFYGCLTAGVVPVPIEVPLSRRDAGCQGVGFLLGSLSVNVALTSELCFKGLPRTQSGEVVTFRGWPKLHWFVTEHLNKPPKDWLPPPRQTDEAAAYIEYSTARDGSVMGITNTRASMLCHCRTLTVACNYTEGEVMVCVLDFKRDAGLWHGVLSSIFNGMHVVFIPYSLMKVDPASWMKMVTKFKASVAVVKSRDMHWGLLAQRDHKEISLASLRLLIVADGANPWSLTSCDSFLSVFQSKGLKPEVICPCASSPEALTVSVRRPGRTGSNATGRGVLSMQGLSHGVVRVDSENSLTSLTLQDCGQVLPGGLMVVTKLNGLPQLCKTDEVGELCLSAPYTGTGYWGLAGVSNAQFKIQPLGSDGKPIGEHSFVRTGLIGFLGPGGLIFVCGNREGLIEIGGRRHNTDDIIATVLAVEPMKFIYRGRIAVFSIKVLKDDRITIIAEQRPDCSEEESFQWMSRVLQAVDSIHQVGVYCLALVPPNYLPKTPLGGIHLHETKKKKVPTATLR